MFKLVVVGAVFVVAASIGLAVRMGGLAGGGAVPAVELLPGVAIEPLATGGPLHVDLRGSSLMLSRYRVDAGGRLDPRSANPVVVYVESGRLTLDAVGERVSIVYPRRISPDPEGGPPEIRGYSEALVSGGSATIPAGWSADADGNFGVMRNQDAEPLVVLGAWFAANPDPADSTVEPSEPGPGSAPAARAAAGAGWEAMTGLGAV